MKKLLSFLGIFVFTAASGLSTVAFKNQNDNIFLEQTYEFLPQVTTSKRELSDVIKTTNLGVFFKIPTNKEILKQVKELNPDVDITQVEVIISNELSALISVKEDSRSYVSGIKGLILVNFVLDLRPKLSSIITNDDLGVFTKLPTEEEILIRVKALNPDLDITQIELNNLTNANVTIRVIRDSKVYLTGIEESILVKFTLDLRVSLSTVYIIKDLGFFTKFPTEEEILIRVKELNPDLDITQIEIFGQPISIGGFLKVIDNSKVYFPESLFENAFLYRIKPIVELSSVILNPNLEFIKFTNDKPNPEEILKKAKDLNPDLDLSQLWISNLTNSSAIINVIDNSKVYFGTNKITVNFIIDQRIKLINDLKNFYAPYHEYVKTGRYYSFLLKNNPGLRIDEIEISSKWVSSWIVTRVTISIKQGSRIYLPTIFQFDYFRDEI